MLAVKVHGLGDPSLRTGRVITQRDHRRQASARGPAERGDPVGAHPEPACELMPTDHPYRSAPDCAPAILFLRAFLDEATEVFRNGREALSSTRCMEVRQVADGGPTTSRRCFSIRARTAIRFGAGSERTGEWINPIQIYARLRYRLNYPLAKLLALRYFELHQHDRAGCAERYTRLLANGYEAPPTDLLRRTLSIELDDGSLVADALRVIETRTAQQEPHAHRRHRRRPWQSRRARGGPRRLDVPPPRRDRQPR